MLQLTKHIVDSKTGHFKPDKFEDRYEEALKDLLKKKQHGERIEVQKAREPSKVINLMDALRRSAKGEAGASTRRGASSRHSGVHPRTSKKAGRSSARHRKAG
jgi:non-homologous end joining protein Ku